MKIEIYLVLYRKMPKLINIKEILEYIINCNIPSFLEKNVRRPNGTIFLKMTMFLDDTLQKEFSFSTLFVSPIYG